MYTVCGYNDICEDFVYVFQSFVEAVKLYLSYSKGMNVVFMYREKPGTCIYLR